MWMPKKSMIGALVRNSSSRTSSTAAVVNTSGVTGPDIASSSWATTSRAISTVEMNGISVRSKCTSGNWMSSALPIVSALMPVLSDRKKTGTTSCGSRVGCGPVNGHAGSGTRLRGSATSVHLWCSRAVAWTGGWLGREYLCPGTRRASAPRPGLHARPGRGRLPAAVHGSRGRDRPVRRQRPMTGHLVHDHRRRWAGPTTARMEAALAVAAGAVTAGAASLVLSPSMSLLVGWDTTAVLYIGWLGVVLLRRDPQLTAARATTTDPDRVATDVLLLVAAVASLVAVGYVLTSDRVGVSEPVAVGVGLTSVVVSWALVHTVYTLRYAALYYGEPVGGIDFDATGPPTYADFAYLAFTIGMTFQVSDTAVRTTAVRRTVLRHALLSYLFGTGILAATINLVASLSR